MKKELVTLKLKYRIELYLILFSLLFIPINLFAKIKPEFISEFRSTWYDTKNFTDSIRLNAGLMLMEAYSHENRDSFFLIKQEMIEEGKKRKEWQWLAKAEHKTGKFYYKRGEPDSAILYYQKAISLVEEDNSPIKIVFLSHLGLVFAKKNQLDSAIFYLESAVSNIEENKPDSYRNSKNISVFGNLATTYKLKGQYLKAIDYFTFCAKYGDRFQKIHTFLNLGDLFQALSMNKEAKENYNNALAFIEKDKDYTLAYCALVSASTNLEEAKTYFQQGLAIAEKSNSTSPKLNILLEFLNLCSDSLWLDPIPKYLKQGFDLAAQLNDEVNRSYLLLIQANYNTNIKRHEESLKILRGIKTVIQENNSITELYSVFKLLGRNFEALGKADSALFYVRQAQILKQKINDQDFSKELISNYFEAKMEQEREMLELEKQNAENKARLAIAQNKQSNLLLILVLVFTSIISLLFYARFQQKKEHSKMLEKEKAQLQRLNKKLLRFSSIISHDILSNLDLVLTTGNVLIGPQPQKEKLVRYYNITQKTSHQLRNYCLALLEESRSTVQKLSPSISQINPMPIIYRVLDRFDQGLSKANLKIDLQDLSPTSFPEALIEQIFQNLISNTLRYGATDQQASLLIKEINTTNGIVQWIIQDNGPGIPLDRHEEIFHRKKNNNTNNNSQSIGLAILKNSLRDFGGDIRVESPQEGGIRWIIQLPQ